LISTKQFEAALKIIKQNKQMQTLDFEKAYILHRMALNSEAFDICKKLPQAEIKN